MRLTQPATLGLALLFATSCKKSDSDSPAGNTLDNITIRKIQDNSVQNVISYRYDNAGNLIQILTNNNPYEQFQYDSQNRLTSFTTSFPGNPVTVDTFEYGANSQTALVYRSTAGISGRTLANKYSYDSRNRLVADTMYNSTGIAYSYAKWYYTNDDDVQSRAVYSGSWGSNRVVTYTRQDSTAHTYDSNINPFYRNRVATSLSGVSTYALSKHNAVSVAIYSGNATQTTNTGPYEVTYYKNGLLRTQLFGSSQYASSRWEFSYK